MSMKQTDVLREFAIAALTGLIIRTYTILTDDFRGDEAVQKSQTDAAEHMRKLKRMWTFAPHEERRAAATAVQYLMGHDHIFDQTPEAVRRIAKEYRIDEDALRALALEVLRGAVTVGAAEDGDWESARGAVALHILREYRPLSVGATVPFIEDIDSAFTLPENTYTAEVLAALVEDIPLEQEIRDALPASLRALLVAVDVIDPEEEDDADA